VCGFPAEIKQVLPRENQQKNPLDFWRGMGRVPASDMKNNQLTTILLGLLTISALASLVLCWLYVSNTRELRTLQSQVAMINNNRNVMTALANDAVEYSKKNQDIDPILVSVGLKPGKGAPTNAPKPSAK
jgi:hypothetical protein